MTEGPTAYGIDQPGRFLLQSGVFLFLLGLLTGFAIPAMSVPRLGLSSHLEGIMNGMFLMLLGLVWPRLSLGKPLATMTLVAAIYGAFANWTATFLAAQLPAGELMPIAAAGVVGTPLAESIVSALLISLAIAMILVCGSLLWGLRKQS